MLIEEFMTPGPITVGPDMSITDAASLMKANKVRRFPVMQEQKLIGIVTDRDLRSAAPSQVISFDEQERALLPDLHDLLAKIRIKDIMTRNVTTVAPRQTIVRAASLMLKHRISGMPVLDARGRLCGIITEGDIFKALVRFAGGHLGKTLFGFRLEDRPGAIKEVADVIRAHGGRLASILTSYGPEDPKLRDVYIRIRDLPQEELEAMKDDLEEKFDLLYMIQDDVNNA